MFDWESKDYNENQNELEQEMASYLDIAVELLGIELKEQNNLQEFYADSEKDENEEAANLERNCTLDELPNMNNPDGQREYKYVKNFDEQEILKVNEEPVNIPRQEEIK